MLLCASHALFAILCGLRVQAYTTFKASLFHAEALAQIGKALHSEGAVGKAIPVLKQASSFLLGTREVRLYVCCLKCFWYHRSC